MDETQYLILRAPWEAATAGPPDFMAPEGVG